MEALLSNLPPINSNGHKDLTKTKSNEGTTKRPSLLKGTFITNFYSPSFILFIVVRQKSQTNGDITDETVDEVAEPVLMIRLPGEQDSEEILSEAMVLEVESKRNAPPARCVVDGQDLPDSAETSQSQEKRTR